MKMHDKQIRTYKDRIYENVLKHDSKTQNIRR